jgi:hypothetical protein
MRVRDTASRENAKSEKCRRDPDLLKAARLWRDDAEITTYFEPLLSKGDAVRLKIPPHVHPLKRFPAASHGLSWIMMMLVIRRGHSLRFGDLT